MNALKLMVEFGYKKKTDMFHENKKLECDRIEVTITVNEPYKASNLR